VKTKTHFAFRVDIWDDIGGSIVEHVAGVDDFEVAEATYRAAVARGPHNGDARCQRINFQVGETVYVKSAISRNVPGEPTK
jgi:hypothetical protein